MNVITLHFIRENEPDEILKVYKRNNDYFRCRFYPSGLNSCFSFNLSREMFIAYIRGTLRMVAEDDVDPYDKVQVTTILHPRILFHVSDIIDPDSDAYDRMWDMLILAWTVVITENELSAAEQSNNNAHSQRIPNFQTNRYFSRPTAEGPDS